VKQNGQRLTIHPWVSTGVVPGGVTEPLAGL